MQKPGRQTQAIKRCPRKRREKSQCLHWASPPLEQVWRRMRAYSPAASALPSPILTSTVWHLTSTERSPGYRICRTSPDLVWYGTSWPPRWRAITVTLEEREKYYRLLSWEQSLQNTETAEDSPYQQSPNGGHLHSDLHRRTRHEGLPPTNKRILEVKKDFFTKENHRKDNSAWEHSLYINTFSERLCQAKGYPEWFPSCTFFRSSWQLKQDSSNAVLQYPPTI